MDNMVEGTNLILTAAERAAIVANTAKISYTDAAAVAANTAKVTNATHTGDVTGSTALTIADEAVTLAKMAHMATASLLGRNTGGTGDVEVLSAATARSLLNVEDGADVTDEANVTDALDNATLTDVGTPASGDLVLLLDASDTNALKVAQFSEFGGGGGGISTLAPALFSASGSTNITTTDATVGLDTEDIDADGSYSIASNEITVSAGTGTYQISYTIPVDEDGTAGSTRGTLDSYMEVDSGGGYSTIAQSRQRDYIRETTDGAGLSSCFIASLTNGDKLRLRIGISAGTDCSTVAGATQVSILKVA